MDALAAFSPDYVTARTRFRRAAARLGWELESHPVAVAHPAGEELTIDVALSPGYASGRALVISCGLHGVEGFFGSAIQLGVLEQWAERGAPPARCVFLHGLNPYGFARLRRFNEDNVDPNRNFLLDGEAYGGSPAGYAELNWLLNPEHPPRRWDAFAIRALLARARLGMPALKQAVVGGQFEFPRGIYFGGSGPSRTTRILTKHLGRWLEGCEDVVHLDFHSGLGRWGTYKLLIDYPLTEGQRQKVIDWFGVDSFEICDPNALSYTVRGGFDRWCVNQFPRKSYLHLTPEFGTYGPVRVIAGIRAENQAYHWGRPDDASTLRAKEWLRELFCPASPGWRRQVFESGCDLIDKATGCLLAGGQVAPLVK